MTAERIRRLIQLYARRFGDSEAQFAERCGISYSHLQKIKADCSGVPPGPTLDLHLQNLEAAINQQRQLAQFIMREPVRGPLQRRRHHARSLAAR